MTGFAPVAAMRFGERLIPGRRIWVPAKLGEHHQAKGQPREHLHQATARGRRGDGFCKAVKSPGIHG